MPRNCFALPCVPAGAAQQQPCTMHRCLVSATRHLQAYIDTSAAKKLCCNPNSRSSNAGRQGLLTWLQCIHRSAVQALGVALAGSGSRSSVCSCSFVYPRCTTGVAQPKKRSMAAGYHALADQTADVDLLADMVVQDSRSPPMGHCKPSCRPHDGVFKVIMRCLAEEREQARPAALEPNPSPYKPRV